MFKKRYYYYFVSYFCNGIAGMAEVTLYQKISTYEDIHLLTLELALQHPKTTSDCYVILNYKPLKPKLY